MNERDEIPITPEMIEAGVEAFCAVLLDMDPYEEIVCDIYRAMEAARPRLAVARAFNDAREYGAPGRI